MFDQVIVIGVGTVACKCAKLLREKNIEVLFIESLNENSLSSKNFCHKNNINYYRLYKSELTKHLTSLDKKTLIISVSNRYLFPLSVLSKKNIKIINYHGALLPKYPGRNAEAWAIYNGEENGGITWHYVVKEVDAGDIIMQKTSPITFKTTSLSLLRDYSKLAFLAFCQIIHSVLEDTAIVVQQKSNERQPVKYSWQIPNDGELNLDWNENTISAFLRAMDYGPLAVLGNPFFIYEGKKYEFSKYQIIEKSEAGFSLKIKFCETSLVIKGENYDFFLSDFKIK